MVSPMQEEERRKKINTHSYTHTPRPAQVKEYFFTKAKQIKQKKHINSISIYINISVITFISLVCFIMFFISCFVVSCALCVSHSLGVLVYISNIIVRDARILFVRSNLSDCLCSLAIFSVVVTKLSEQRRMRQKNTHCGGNETNMHNCTHKYRLTQPQYGRVCCEIFVAMQ